MSAPVEISTENGIRTIRMSRPDKKNALTRAMYAAMTEALLEANDDDSIRVCVFLGVPGAFSAGNDMGDFLAFAQGGSLGTEVLDFLAALAGARKPLVAGVDGLAIGIGTTLVMHCDLAVASDRTLFRTPFVDLGLVPEAGSSLLGPRIMGYQDAFAMLALGEDFNADEARTARLVRKVVASEALEAETLAAAARIAAKPVQAMALSRSLLRDGEGTLTERIAREAELFAERLTSDEAKAAFMAFMMRKAG